MTAPERRGPERPGPEYPSEWDREPADDSLFEDCPECEGWGGWTETYERSGRDFDVAVDCNECGGSGVR